jgi:hypothetical protein
MTISEREIIPVPQVEARVSIPKQNLRVPGPTPIPQEVMEAQAAQMINHRGPEFSAIMKRVTLRLQYFFQTTSFRLLAQVDKNVPSSIFSLQEIMLSQLALAVSAIVWQKSPRFME